MMQERLRAGLARANGEGKRFGRSPIASPFEKRIREAGRPGVRKIAARFGVILAQCSASTALSRQEWPAAFNEVVRRSG
jgi:DNA invertase Pin-like site-specific DNA recombinase